MLGIIIGVIGVVLTVKMSGFGWYGANYNASWNLPKIFRGKPWLLTLVRAIGPILILVGIITFLTEL